MTDSLRWLPILMVMSGCGALSPTTDAGARCDAGTKTGSDGGCVTLAPTDAGDGAGCDGGTKMGSDGGCIAIPVAGANCPSPGYWCQDLATALECRGPTWIALPCRGDGGCTNTAGLIRCDITGNLEGDLCASTAEGKGLCTPDGKGTLECRGGALVKTNTCLTCTVSGDLVICQP